MFKLTNFVILSFILSLYANSTCTGFFSLGGAGGCRNLPRFHFCECRGSSTGRIAAGGIAVAAGGIGSLLESLSLPEVPSVSSPLEEAEGTGDIGPTGSGKRGDSSTLTSGDDSLQYANEN